MRQRFTFLTAAAVALGLALGAASLQAFPANRLTYLTFSGAVALPGVTLPAGSYAFELADSNATNIVLVRNRERSRVYFLGFTDRVARPAGISETSTVTFGEAAPGQPRPIAVWYPPSSGDGLQFRYR